MSYGFVIRSGSGAIVESISTDRPPGVLLDSFVFVYSTTPTTKTYPAFAGRELLPIVQSLGAVGSEVIISVNNTTKTFSIAGRLPASQTPANSNAHVVILGV